MKKILFTVAALGLGLGLAASVAAAEMSFSATGKYVVTGEYVSDGADGNGLKADLWGPAEANDMIQHLFYVYPKLKVNDNITMNAEIRMIDRDVWGVNVNDAATENMRLRLAWMDYMSPVGTISVGRILGGGWGSAFLDSTGNRDRIKWATNFMPENMGLTFIYQKSAEVDSFLGNTDESDTAAYYAGLSFKADFGKTDVAFWHTRYDGSNGVNDYNNTELWLNGSYKFGGVNLDAELSYGFGDDGGTAGAADISSLGAMVNAYTQMDALTAGVLFFYLQGDTTVDGDNEGYIGRNGVGNDYNPFLIATHDYTGLFNGDRNGYIFGGTGNSGNEAGAIALAMWGKFAASDKLTINGAVGHIWADETWSGVDDAVGFEVDLGMSYKLLDNLTYSAGVGYLNPGSMVDDLAGTESVNDIYLLSHSLTMTF